MYISGIGSVHESTTQLYNGKELKSPEIVFESSSSESLFIKVIGSVKIAATTNVNNSELSLADFLETFNDIASQCNQRRDNSLKRGSKPSNCITFNWLSNLVVCEYKKIPPSTPASSKKYQIIAGISAALGLAILWITANNAEPS